MSAQLEAITGHSRHTLGRGGCIQGFAYSLRPKIRRYFDRKPGWVVQEVRHVQRRTTDWEFLAKMGRSIPVWMRP